MTPASKIHSLSATELAESYRSRQLSPIEAAEALLARIELLDGEVNAFCIIDPDETLGQARASEARLAADEPLSRLDGVPVAIKDVFLTRGWPTRKGSRLVDPAQPWTEDAPAVTRLREAGAVLIGKTTTPEFGWKGLTDSPLTGITRNPWNTTKTPGGSSGGSATALAAGMAPLALGTDGGGSIRIPGAFTGTVGLKPTFGRVPYAPMSRFGTVAHAGPMARTVADTVALYRAIAVYDRRDWTALPTDPHDDERDSGGRLDGLRVLFSLTLGFAEVDPEVAAMVIRAAGLLEGVGAAVTAGDPEITDPTRTWQTLWYAGAAAIVAGLDAGRSDEVDPGLLEIADQGAWLSAIDYVTAFQDRIDVAVSLGATLAEYDVLITPTMPIPAFEAGIEVPPSWPHRRWETWSPFTLPFNLSQQPAATVPCGVTADGLPVGVQIVAAKHRDDVVLRVAAAYEAARDQGDASFGRPVGRSYRD